MSAFAERPQDRQDLPSIERKKNGKAAGQGRRRHPTETKIDRRQLSGYDSGKSVRARDRSVMTLKRHHCGAINRP